MNKKIPSSVVASGVHIPIAPFGGGVCVHREVFKREPDVYLERIADLLVGAVTSVERAALTDSALPDAETTFIALEPSFEFLTNLAPSDPEVFYKNRFAFAIQRFAGAASSI